MKQRGRTRTGEEERTASVDSDKVVQRADRILVAPPPP
ncbi:hypothetical protein A2U01_0111727, partial [Trifolium medium]|nr:hypothetical protein [Trifolium medium]